MAGSDFAQMVQDGVFDVQVTELSDSFLRVKDGVTYTAIVRPLKELEIPVLLLEGGENPNDLDWRAVERLPVTCPLAPGDWIVFPATGRPDRDRYLVRGVNTDTTGGLSLWLNATIARSRKAQAP